MENPPPAPWLVRKDPATGQLVLNESTLRALRRIQGPVGVVGICGGARKGKSSLLNRIMECQGSAAQSFQISSEVDPCTKGLHISTVPLPATDDSGEPYSLLFLDTEGIDATDQDCRDMAQVFTLCVLLSSVVLLNELACISEGTLDMLSLVSKVAGIVHARWDEPTQHDPTRQESTQQQPTQKEPSQEEPSQQDPTQQQPTQQEPSQQEPSQQDPTQQQPTQQESSQQEPTQQDPTQQEPTQQGPGGDQNSLKALEARSSFTPTLFWVLRDFSLLMKGGVSPTDYMEKALEDLPEEGARAASAAEKNRVRRGIRALFPARRCFTLVRPVFEEERLQEGHKEPLTALRPQFQAEVKQLAQAACAAARPPLVQGAPLTGPILAFLCEAYVAAMNAGAVPNIESVHLAALEEACVSAVEKALQLYGTALGEPQRGKADSLQELHHRGVSEALLCFAQGTKGFPEALVVPYAWEVRAGAARTLRHFEAQVRAQAAEHLRKTVLEKAKVGAMTGAAGGCAVLVARAAASAAPAAAVAALAPGVAACVVVGGLVGLGMGMIASMSKGNKSDAPTK